MYLQLKKNGLCPKSVSALRSVPAAHPGGIRCPSQPLKSYNRSHMQLASSARIPDGFMAAMRLGGEKPHQGLPGRNPALYQGPTVCNSTTALGLQAAAVLNRIGSCSTGKERDTESGNDYFGARYYSSAMGRFMSPDWAAKAEPVPYAVLGDPQSLNLYAYVRNNPLSRADADGHCDWCKKLLDAVLNKISPLPPPPPVVGTTRKIAINNDKKHPVTVGYNKSPAFAADGKMNPVYKTAQAASNAAAKADGALTAKDGHEYGEPVFSYGPGQFSYSTPMQGTATNAEGGASCCNDPNADANIPPGTTLAGFSHSHPDPSVPSMADITSLNVIQTVSGSPAVGAVSIPGSGTVPIQSTGAFSPAAVQNLGGPDE